MTALTHPSIPTTTSAVPHGLRLVGAGTRLWRVVDRAGRVVGHIQTSEEADALRFHALRYSARIRRFLEVGRFWSLDDAVSCLHYVR
ncbi:hypothetical protein [Microbacterium invictum]|uniref:DNA mismatch repair protein n=1 Tax=Microbacterium invictum TaxID=515415 RepID=A0ABZ0V7P5_9MICO|nr:hypothetical protein [Microbacterium invictum]WQB68808.1 hypothetical protein T9R20_08720 [Microbacterium invictum]